jgi:DNA-binding NtrC family response regulator
MSVLIVDDEPALLRLMQRSLRSPELEVLTANGGPDALALLRRRTVDVILSDIDMPEMTGFDLLAILRREHPTVIRMIFTAAATTERAVAAINDGEVARFFVKPIDVEQLRATLLSFRDRVHRVRREAEQMRHRARVDALVGWAENRFPGSTEIARDESGAIVVDRAAYALVFGSTR